MVEIYQSFGAIFYPTDVDSKYDQTTRNVSKNTKSLFTKYSTVTLPSHSRDKLKSSKGSFVCRILLDMEFVIVLNWTLTLLHQLAENI